MNPIGFAICTRIRQNFGFARAVLNRIGASPHRNMRLDIKLSFMFILIDSVTEKKRVDDDHCFAGRMVRIERGVCRDALLRYSGSSLAHRARCRWTSDARQLAVAILLLSKRSSA